MVRDDSVYDRKLSGYFLQNVITDLSSLDRHYKVYYVRTQPQRH